MRSVTGLFIRYEMVKAMSNTESLMFVVGQLFGKSEAPAKELNSAGDMMAFARALNG